jgi:small conductance mechanosensitive channel
MKKRYLLIFYVLLIIGAILLYFYSSLDPLIVDLIIVNIVIYIIRTPLVRLIGSIFKKKVIVRVIVSAFLNLIWIIFLLWLLFVLSPETFVALLSFLIVAVSLSFKSLVRNISSGFLMLTAEQFEVGDIIETNEVQGLVQEINLTYTKLKELDGVSVIVPNVNIFDATIIKFTHKLNILLDFSEKEKEEQQRKRYKKIIDISSNLFKDKEITRYDKSLEITADVDPKDLDSLLNEVFDDYEPKFRYRPDYVVDKVTVNRCRLDLIITAKTPELFLKYLDAFLRDVLFKLHEPAIYRGWEEYKKTREKEQGGA